MTLLRLGEVEEGGALVVVGVLREAAVEGAARQLVGVHLADPRDALRLG
jgi:hypothetical protein